MHLGKNRWLALSALSLVVACEPVPPSNPFDPDAPVETQAKATLEGRVVLEEEGALDEILRADLGRVAVELRDAQGETVARSTCVPSVPKDVEMDCDGAPGAGAFSFAGLTPGRYDLRVDGVPARYLGVTQHALTLVAGEQHLLAPLSFRAAAPGEGSGADAEVAGEVRLRDATGGPRDLTLYRATGAGVVVHAQQRSDGDGRFLFTGLPPGTYALSAELAGFAPDYRVGFELRANDDADAEPERVTFADDDALELFQASAVVVPDVPAAMGRFYTAADSVPVRVLAFGGMSGMRLAANPTFNDDDGAPLGFVPHSTGAEVRLPETEGAITLYAQFENTAHEGFSFVTSAFTTEVVRDVTPPAVQRVSVVGKAPDGDGVLWLTEEAATLTLDVEATDVHSAVAEIAVVVGEAPQDPASLSFSVVNAPAGFVRLQQQVGLPAGEGAHPVHVYLRDRAGNASAPSTLEVVVDVTPPVTDEPPLVADNAVGGVLRDTVAALRVRLPATTTDDGGTVVDPDRPAWMRVGVAPLASVGALEPFEETRAVSFTGAHGEQVQLAALLRDNAGNEALVTSPIYTLDLSGELVGTVRVEGGAEASPTHGGVAVALYAAGDVPGADAPLASSTSSSDGSFVLGSIPEGQGYLLELARADLRRQRVAVPAIVRGATATVGTIPLALARGNVEGRFVRGDLADSPDAHGGILVTAALAGQVVAQTVTQQDGSYRFPYPGLPITLGNARYALQGTSTGYAPAVQDGVQVNDDATTVVAPLPADPSRPSPVGLSPLSGDFDLCLVDDVTCTPRQYTRAESVRVRLRQVGNVTDIRFRARTPFAADDDSASAPAWQGSFFDDVVYAADIAGAEGPVEVFVQLRIDDQPGPVLSSSIVLDQTPPDVTELRVYRGEGALRDDLTSAVSVRAEVRADPGQGDVAPLQQAYVVVADAPPPAPPPVPAGAAVCQHAASCEVFLPGHDSGAVVEGAHTVYALSCDRAQNCSAPVAVDVVHDRTAPSGLHGVTFAPASPMLREHAGVRYTRTSQYSLSLNVGEATHADGTPLFDVDGARMPDVLAYRMSVAWVGAGQAPASVGFEGVAWQELAGDVAPGAAMTGLLAPSLFGDDGRYRVFLQLMDGAGNRTALEPNPHFFDVVLDTAPPPASLVINDGEAVTNDPALALRVESAATDPLVEAHVTGDGGLFATYTSHVVDGTDVVIAHDLGAGAADGSYSVHARLFDAAGNVAERQASVLLDRTPPLALAVACGTCGNSDGNLFARDRAVVVDVLATDETSRVVSTHVVVNDALGAPVFESEEPYASAASVILGADDGLYEIVVTFTDAAGNQSLPELLYVELDRAAPAGTATIADGASHTNRRDVSVALTGVAADVVSMSVSSSAPACESASYQALSSLFFVQLGPGDGEKQVYVCLRDGAGNTALVSDSIVLDTAPPSGTLTLDDGAPYTSHASGEVSLRLVSDDATEYAARNTSLSCEAAEYTPLTSPLITPHTLAAGGDGARLVVACLRDAGGNVTSLDATITLDRAAPEGGVVIAGGASATTSALVNVSLPSSPDTARMAVQNGAIDCDAATWQAYAPTLADWSLLAGSPGEGTKTVSACFEDAAGNRSQASSAIWLDTVAPAGDLLLQGGATHVATRTISVEVVNASDDVTAMAVGEGVACASAGYGAFTASSAYTLSLGEAQKTVVLCLKDAAGNVRETQAQIVYDATPAGGTLVLAGGASHTSSSLVSVSGASLSEPVVYALGNEALDCASASYGATFSTTLSVADWALTPTDGLRRVVACLKDQAGNLSSLEDTVVLDRLSPTGTVLVEGGALFTQTTTVTLSLSAPADVTRMAIENDAVADCADVPAASFGPYAPSVAGYALAAGADGERVVTVCFEDAAGLRYLASDTIVLDTQAPGGTLVLAGGSGFVSTSSVAVTVEGASDDVVSMALGEGIACASASYGAFAPHTTYTLSAGEGPKTVRLCLKDAAGWVHDTAALVSYDVSPPTGTLVIDGGAAYAITTTVSVTAESVNEPVVYALGNEALDCSSASYTALFEPSLAEPSFALRAEDGTRTVLACLKDRAGNTRTLSASIVLDREAPAGAVVIDGGAAYTQDLLVTLALTGAADTTRMAVANGELASCDDFTAGDFTAFAPSVADFALVDGSDGERVVSVCLEDAAGLRSFVTGRIVLDRDAPAGTLELAGGAAFVKESVVSARVSGASGDVVAMALVEGVSCGAASYVPFAATSGYALSAGEGAKTVRLCLKDASGWVGEATDSLTYDATPPAGASLEIVGLAAGGASATLTRSHTVDLVLAGTDANLAGLQVSNSNDFTGAPLHDVGTLSGWTLEPGDGVRTVYARAVDQAGNTSPVSASILVDTQGPVLGGVRLVGRRADGSEVESATAVLDVEVELAASGATRVALATAPLDCASVSYDVEYAARLPFTLSPSGVVHACVRDDAGNTAGPVSDTIVVDQAPPACSVTLTGYRADGVTSAPAGSTATRGVDVTSACGVETPAQMALAASDAPLDCQTAAYTTFAASTRFTLSEGDGPKNVQACYRDALGNATATPVSAAVPITLDSAAPTSPALVLSRVGDGSAQPATHTNVASVHLHLAAEGATQMRFANDSAFSVGSSGWLGYGTSAAAHTLAALTSTCAAAPNGEARSVYAQFRDDVGNESAVVRTSVVLDPCAPDAPTVTAVRSPGSDPTGTFVNSRDVTLSLSGAANATGLRFLLRENGAFPCPGPAAASDSYDLAPGLVVTTASEGFKRACVRLEDAAGNVSDLAQETFTVDTTQPGAPSLSPGSGTNVNRACARITPSLAGEPSFWKWQQRQNGGPWQDTVVDGDGKLYFGLLDDSVNTLSVRALDRAGNVGADNAVLIDEVSSRFVATPLTVKHVCDGGRYAILKDLSLNTTAATGATCDATSRNYSFPTGLLPEVSLLDLQTGQLRRFDGPTGTAAYLQSGDNHRVLDAACSPQAGESAMLVSYLQPRTACGSSAFDALMFVHPDPVDDPTAEDVSIRTILGESANNIHAPGNTNINVTTTSIDVLDWTDTSVWNFRALTSDNALGGFINLRMLTASGGATTWGRVTTSDYYQYTLVNQNRIKGLGFFGSGAHWLRRESGSWRVYHASSPGAATSLVASFTDAQGFTASNSPWGPRIKPATFWQGAGSPAEARMYYTMVTAAGEAYAVRGDFTPGTDVAPGYKWRFMGAGAPTNSFPAHFDTGTQTVHWVDVDDESRLHRDDDYTIDDVEHLRWPVDTSKPLHSAMGSGAGARFALYHTSALEQGAVIVYEDAAGCVGD